MIRSALGLGMFGAISLPLFVDLDPWETRVMSLAVILGGWHLFVIMTPRTYSEKEESQRCPDPNCRRMHWESKKGPRRRQRRGHGTVRRSG